MPGPLRTALGRLDALTAAGLLCAALAGLAPHVPARAITTPSAAPLAPPPGVKVAQAPARPAETRPGWNELSADQKRALQPLAGTWGSLSEGQKRKWIALSRNFASLPPAEQAKMHSRMTDWVALSPQQRAQARLNFGETKNLSADDKKAKWEAYQALPEEEKRRLAAGANTRTSPTAAAVKPVPPQRLANVPRSNRESKPPRIAAGPNATEATPAAVPVPPQPQAN